VLAERCHIIHHGSGHGCVWGSTLLCKYLLQVCVPGAARQITLCHFRRSPFLCVTPFGWSGNANTAERLVNNVGYRTVPACRSGGAQFRFPPPKLGMP